MIAIAVCLGGYGLRALADTFSDPGGVPRLIPFRAHIEQGGVPVTSPVTLSFAIYDAPSGGAVLWGPEAHTVTPAGGDISVMLGQTVRLSPSVLQGGDAYVQISVGSAVLGRQRLGSVPYALRAANGTPSGAILAFGSATPPDGWLPCDGRALDKDDPTYAALYAAIGTTWGDGSTGTGANGETDFNVPDLRGVFVRGLDEGRGIDPGRALAPAPQAHALESHSHGVNDPGHQHPFRADGGGSTCGSVTWPSCGGYSRLDPISGPATTGITIQATGGTETRPVNVAVPYIIKL